jgi:hypothetical protein
LIGGALAVAIAGFLPWSQASIDGLVAISSKPQGGGPVLLIVLAAIAVAFGYPSLMTRRLAIWRNIGVTVTKRNPDHLHLFELVGSQQSSKAIRERNRRRGPLPLHGCGSRNLDLRGADLAGQADRSRSVSRSGPRRMEPQHITDTCTVVARTGSCNTVARKSFR